MIGKRQVLCYTITNMMWGKRYTPCTVWPFGSCITNIYNREVSAMNSTRSSDQAKIVLVVVVILVITLILSIFSFIDWTPTNDITAVGNTAGNLYNGGYFCEYEGDVYFSLPADNHSVYKMSMDGSAKKLNIKDAYSLNIYNGHLFYSRNGAKDGARSFLDGIPYGIYRYSLKTGSSKSLSSSLSPYICLAGNTIFFQEYTHTSLYFSKVNIKDRNKNERISTAGYPIACAEDGYLYYTELGDNHNVIRYNVRTDQAELFYEGNCHQSIYTKGILYFIDLADGYALKKYNTSTGELTTIVNDRCVNYNVRDSVVFYEIENPDSGRYGLYRNNTDGTGEELITETPCKHINMTSEYTYFQYYNDDENFYRTSTQGPVNVQLFYPE